MYAYRYCVCVGPGAGATSCRKVNRTPAGAAGRAIRVTNEETISAKARRDGPYRRPIHGYQFELRDVRKTVTRGRNPSERIPLRVLHPAIHIRGKLHPSALSRPVSHQRCSLAFLPSVSLSLPSFPSFSRPLLERATHLELTLRRFIIVSLSEKLFFFNKSIRGSFVLRE